MAAGVVMAGVIVVLVIAAFAVTIDRQQAADGVEANRPGLVSTQRKSIRRS
jgi:hypothetical protein